MRDIDKDPRFDRSPQGWSSESESDRVGPQGSALIHELQRLRQALDDERGGNRRRKPNEPRKPQPPRKPQAPQANRAPLGNRAPQANQAPQGSRAPKPRQAAHANQGPQANRAPRAHEAPQVRQARQPRPAQQPPQARQAAQARRAPQVLETPQARPQPYQAPPAKQAQRPNSPQWPTGPQSFQPPARIPQARTDRPQPRPGMDEGINAWLPPSPPKTPIQSEAHREGPIEPLIGPPRRQSPPIAPVDPLFMDLAAPAPEMRMLEDGHRSTISENAPPALPAKIEPPTTKWIGKCRDGLSTGLAFLLDRDGAPPPSDDEGLLVRTTWGFEHELRVGLRILVIALVLGGGWLTFVPIAGAVVVPGSLVVQSNVKQIQHPTGGVVAEIKAQNGARVEAGDLLVRLDATQAKANLQVVTKQLDEIRARMARLTAERDGKAEIQFPAELLTRASEGDVVSLLASEEQLFTARATTRQSQKDLLTSQIAQLTQQISGLDAQVESKAKELELIQGELSGVQDLYDKRLVPLTRLTSLQRDAARIDGERGQLVSSIAETKGKIDQSKLQMVRIDQDFRAEVVKDLNEAQGKEAELVERGIAARDQLDRIDIRAPTSGTVNQLAIHTVGGVIKAGETIMQIVPDTDDLQIEAQVDPKDIDHVRTGQTAFVKLTAFNQRTTPQLKGSVTYVSADTGHDQQSNKSFYTVRIVLPEEERRRLSGQQLVPGMPSEVSMQTGSRTMLSYLFEPITDQLRRAFVEQ